MLHTRQLQALRAVADTGSVARAGMLLSWSQPTIVHHLRALQAEVGAAIVTPSSAGTTLTAVGKQLLPHAVAVLDRLDRAAAEVRAFAEERRRTLCLGVFPTVASQLLPLLLPELRSHGFDVLIREAEVDTLRADVLDLRLDAAVVYTEAAAQPFARDLSSEFLFAEPLVLVCPESHPLALSEEVSFRDLGAEKWILGAQPNGPLENFIRGALADHGHTPEVFARSDDYRVVTAYVAAGHGIAVVPVSALDGGGAGSLRPLRLARADANRRVHLVANAGVSETTRRMLIDAVLVARDGSALGRPTAGRAVRG